jgi:predicted transglutaminase-like cysteine proteinase
MPRLKDKFNTATAFLKNLATGALVASLGCSRPHLPENIPDAECAKPDALTFTFENSSTPPILGEKTKGAFNKDKSGAGEKWNSVIGRHTILLTDAENLQSYKRWMSQLDSYSNETIATKARAVDGLVDRTIQYETDKNLFGQEDDGENYDYWASPIETLTARHQGETGWGDCEDFAILKYFSLRYLEVPVEKIYVVFVRNKTDIMAPSHMLTMVDINEKAEQAQHFVILNNDKTPQGQLIEVGNISYAGFYAMNEKGFWSIPANSNQIWKSAPEKPRSCIPPPGPKPALPLTEQRAL